MFWGSYVFLKTRVNQPLHIDNTMQSEPLAQIHSNLVYSIYGLAMPDVDILCPPLAHIAVAPGHATLEVVLCVLGAAVLYVLKVVRDVQHVLQVPEMMRCVL
jgi:hypothetical protein